MVNTMNNKIAGHRFLAFGLAVSLTVTGITGCTMEQADTAGSEEAAQSTAKEQVLKGHNEMKLQTSVPGDEPWALS